jgi:hypothetical protein
MLRLPRDTQAVTSQAFLLFAQIEQHTALPAYPRCPALLLSVQMAAPLSPALYQPLATSP